MLLPSHSLFLLSSSPISSILLYALLLTSTFCSFFRFCIKAPIFLTPSPVCYFLSPFFIFFDIFWGDSLTFLRQLWEAWQGGGG